MPILNFGLIPKFYSFKDEFCSTCKWCKDLSWQARSLLNFGAMEDERSLLGQSLKIFGTQEEN